MTIRKLFETFMAANQIPVYPFDTEEGVPTHLGIRLKGDNGNFDGYALCFEKERLFVFYTRLNLRASLEQREKIAVKLAEINYMIKIGGFQMDPESGEITVRTAHYMTGTDVEQGAVIERLVRVSGLIADKYYSQISEMIETR